MQKSPCVRRGYDIIYLAAAAVDRISEEWQAHRFGGYTQLMGLARVGPKEKQGFRLANAAAIQVPQSSRIESGLGVGGRCGGGGIITRYCPGQKPGTATTADHATLHEPLLLFRLFRGQSDVVLDDLAFSEHALH